VLSKIRIKKDRNAWRAEYSSVRSAFVVISCPGDFQEFCKYLKECLLKDLTVE
jgi:hypothetical protein